MLKTEITRFLEGLIEALMNTNASFALELQITDLTWCSLYFMHNDVNNEDTDKTPHICAA